MTNLIMNSIKHGFKDRNNCKIKIDIDYDNNHNITIHYRDNGAGIPKDIQSKIYEPFYTTDRKDGSGLGMHMVYNLVTQKLKGNITLLSEEGEGVYFKITLPNLIYLKGKGGGIEK